VWEDVGIFVSVKCGSEDCTCRVFCECRFGLRYVSRRRTVYCPRGGVSEVVVAADVASLTGKSGLRQLLTNLSQRGLRNL